jgi:hypothetical protein
MNEDYALYIETGDENIKGSWEMPSNMNRFRFDETKIEEIYDTWSKEIYTCRIDYSQYELGGTRCSRTKFGFKTCFGSD